MTDKKQTMYEVLEVPPSASLQDIKAAHRRLTQLLASGKPLPNPEQIELRRQVLNLALDTLSNEVNRNAYDAKLAAHSPSAATASKANTSLVPQGLDARAILTLASLEGARGSAKNAILPPAVQVMASAVDKSASALWKILRIVAGVLVLIILVSVASAILKGRQAKQPGGGPLSAAEEKVMIQEYYQQHGVRPGSKAELDLLEIERQRKVNAQRAVEVEKAREDEAYRRFVEDSRRRANQVSNDLWRDEEIASRHEEQESRQQMQEKQRQEYEKRAEEEAAGNRDREARRRAGLPN